MKRDTQGLSHPHFMSALGVFAFPAIAFLDYARVKGFLSATPGL